jgi:hypothetical protein
VQRERVHLAFQRWFGIKGSREGEYTHRLDPAELLCMDAEWRERLQPRRLYEEAKRLSQKRRLVALEQLATLQPEVRRTKVQERWEEILGESERRPSAKLLTESSVVRRGIRISRVVLETDPGILVPALILAKERGPVRRAGIVCVAQGGKNRFLCQRNSAITRLLEAGVTICLIDVRGTGESDLGVNRGRTGASTELSSSILMLGDTLVRGRLWDLRAVLGYLRDCEDIAANRLAVWGDSLAIPNQNDDSLLVPMGAELGPAMAEPLGGILGLLVALFEEDLVSVYTYGGLIAYESTLNGPFCYIPHDVVVPGAIPAGDLPLLAKIMGSTKLRLDGLVDGMNCKVESQLARRDYDEAVLGAESFDDLDVAEWLLKSLGMTTASVQ